MRIVHQKTLCIGCQACVIACKEQHQLPVDINRCRIAFEPTAEMVGSAFSFKTCYQCHHAKCKDVCQTGALYKESCTGIVKYDATKCTLCGDCITACPFEAIIMNDKQRRTEKCDLCSGLDTGMAIDQACIKACPYGLLQLEEK